jgi:hypothetical protein
VEDVARLLAARLANPQPHIGKIYHLIGPQSENMHVYAQYSYLLAMIRGYARRLTLDSDKSVDWKAADRRPRGRIHPR